MLLCVVLNLICSTFVLLANAQEYCAKDSLDEKCVFDSGFIDESLNHLDQEDPILIEAIKKLLVPVPSAGKHKTGSDKILKYLKDIYPNNVLCIAMMAHKKCTHI